MRDNVLAIDAWLADGSLASFGALDPCAALPDGRLRQILPGLLALGRDNQAEIMAKFPKVLRRVGGYNIDALMPDAMACLLYTSPSPRDRTRSRMPSSA